jgi:hypothetical protein
MKVLNVCGKIGILGGEILLKASLIYKLLIRIISLFD